MGFFFVNHRCNCSKASYYFEVGCPAAAHFIYSLSHSVCVWKKFNHFPPQVTKKSQSHIICTGTGCKRAYMSEAITTQLPCCYFFFGGGKGLSRELQIYPYIHSSVTNYDIRVFYEVYILGYFSNQSIN